MDYRARLDEIEIEVENECGDQWAFRQLIPIARALLEERDRLREGLEEKYWACQRALYQAYRAGANIPDIHGLLEPEAYEEDYRYERG